MNSLPMTGLAALSRVANASAVASIGARGVGVDIWGSKLRVKRTL